MVCEGHAHQLSSRNRLFQRDQHVLEQYCSGGLSKGSLKCLETRSSVSGQLKRPLLDRRAIKAFPPCDETARGLIKEEQGPGSPTTNRNRGLQRRMTTWVFVLPDEMKRFRLFMLSLCLERSDQLRLNHWFAQLEKTPRLVEGESVYVHTSTTAGLSFLGAMDRYSLKKPCFSDHIPYRETWRG